MVLGRGDSSTRNRRRPRLRGRSARTGRKSLRPRQVTRAMWADSVADYIVERGLENVVLAGHSLGGLTISGVAQKIPNRIKRVVYVTAFVPRDGVSLMADAAAAAGTQESIAGHALPHGAASTIVNDNFRAHFIQDAPRALQDFVLAAVVPEAIGPALEPAPMKEFASARFADRLHRVHRRHRVRRPRAVASALLQPSAQAGDSAGQERSRSDVHATRRMRPCAGRDRARVNGLLISVPDRIGSLTNLSALRANLARRARRELSVGDYDRRCKRRCRESW